MTPKFMPGTAWELHPTRLSPMPREETAESRFRVTAAAGPSSPSQGSSPRCRVGRVLRGHPSPSYHFRPLLFFRDGRHKHPRLAKLKSYLSSPNFSDASKEENPGP